MKLPQLLVNTDEAPAVGVLQCYCGKGAHELHGPFTGSWFDTWDTTGSRDSDADRFTADDLVAISWLSVDVKAPAARALLETHASSFSDLLRELGPDRDLVAERVRWPDDWAGWRLWSALDGLPDVGPTIASKLLARKRPRLRPIYDTVVAQVIGTTRIWEPLRACLQDDPRLHPRLLSLRGEAHLSDQVPALRVFDVLAWMEGKGLVTCTGGTTKPRSSSRS